MYLHKWITLTNYDNDLAEYNGETLLVIAEEDNLLTVRTMNEYETLIDSDQVHETVPMPAHVANHLMKQLKICDCNCHTEGLSILHCAPCCSHTYEKYLDAQGNFIFENWAKLQTI